LFLLFLIILTLFFSGKIERPDLLLLIYSVLAACQVLLLRADNWFRQGRRREIFRDVIFPVIAVLVIFDSLGLIVHKINPRDIDPLLIRLDYILFQGYPTVMIEAMADPLLTDVLQIAYTTYYFLPITLGLILKARGMDAAFDRALFLILFCFYLSYIGYILFPALGPRYTMDHLQTGELRGIFIAGPVQEFLNRLEGIKRDAFPSGHTGVALVVSWLGRQYHRGFFLVTLPVVSLLVFSTVYCRYHYVVDVIGGMMLAAITIILGKPIYGYWEERRDTRN
ncbi:MAG: phosphatase PAP2 family protein, partial [Candidatus Dadabacteria bacterium]